MARQPTSDNNNQQQRRKWVSEETLTQWEARYAAGQGRPSTNYCSLKLEKASKKEMERKRNSFRNLERPNYLTEREDRQHDPRNEEIEIKST